MKEKTAWSWVPTLYFAQGLPNIIVTVVSVVMFKKMGLDNTEIAFYTSWFNLPWVLKPFWSPIIDMFKTKRFWVVLTQLLFGGCTASIAFIIPGPYAFKLSLAFMWLLAFSSATHDIAADGFYLLALDKRKQAFFVGIRNTAFRLAMLTGQGLVVMLAGYFENLFKTTNPEEIAITKSWSITFYIITALFFIIFIYHNFVLPKPIVDKPVRNGNFCSSFIRTFISFFKKKGIIEALSFILFFRFAEAQLVKIASPFLIDDKGVGGLGLSTLEIGTVYGIVGIISLVVGGILGGIYLSYRGFKKSIWFMTLAMNIPNLVYVFLSFTHTSNLWLISSCVLIEQLGYGFGFTAFTYFMMLFSKGENQTAHYAICTGFMALGLMFPQMFSGWIQEQLGYQNFFLWIMLCTLPSFLVAGLVRKQNF